MVTSTSLISDAGPAVNQRPVVTASVDASNSNNNNSSSGGGGMTTYVSSRASLPPHLGSSQSLPATTVTSQVTAGDPSHAPLPRHQHQHQQQMLPSYRQASLSTSSETPSSSASPRPQSPGAHPHPHPQRPLNASLPDILHSHLGPSLRPNQHRQNRDRQRSRTHGEDGPSRPPGQHRHHRSRGDRAGNRRNRTVSTSSAQGQEAGGSCKEPCVKCVATITSFRWVLVVLSILGVCCVVSGIILAALHAVGNSFLFLAIMFIGLGVLLVVVVAVGWRCTPRGHEPLHALFRIGQFHNRRTTRERRHRRHRNRDGNWFGGVLYPEFQYRRPPPSYAASMQDYNNHSLQELRTSGALSSGNIDSASLPSSPPPSYRSRTSTVHSGIHSTFPGGQSGELPNSRPPTYRSRAPSRRPSLPREERRELDHGGDAAPADIDFTEPAATEVDTTGSTSQPANNVFTLSSSSPSIPVAAPVVTSLSSVSSPASQTYTVNTNSEAPAMQIDAHSSQPRPNTSHIPQNGASDFAQDNNSAHVSSHSEIPPSLLPSSSSASAQVPSLHQRMKSQDREMLEKALQSLDKQMHAEEERGHVNLGATFSEPDHYDTHL